MLREDERAEPLPGGLTVFQKRRGYRFGTDAVLLAAHALPRAGEPALDLCSGCGIVPLLLARSPAAHITGLELQHDIADMAARCVAANGLSDRLSMRCGDLRKPEHVPQAAFSLVTANPPYRKTGAGARSPDGSVELARSEAACTLEQLCAAAFRALRAKGRFVLVHRPERLADLMCALRGAGLEPKALRFVQATARAAPSLLLVRAVKGGAPGLAASPPLLLDVLPAETLLRQALKGEPVW